MTSSSTALRAAHLIYALAALVSAVVVAPAVELRVEHGPGGTAVALTNGSVAAGANVEISAAALPYYSFARWHDGETANPRTITLSAGINSYTAIFTNTQPIAEIFEPAAWPILYVPGLLDARTMFSTFRMSDGSMVGHVRFTGGGLVSSPPSGSLHKFHPEQERSWGVSELVWVRAEGNDQSLLGLSDRHVVALHRDGSTLWQHTLENPFDYLSTGPIAISQNASGAVWILGRRSNQLFLQKLSHTGQAEWRKLLDVPLGNGLIAPASDEGALVCGQDSSNNHLWMVRFDSSGQVRWQTNWSMAADWAKGAVGVRQLGDGWIAGYTAAGPVTNAASVVAHGGADLRILHLDDAGRFRRDLAFGGSASDSFTAFSFHPQSGWHVVGTSASGSGSGKRSVKAKSGDGTWLIKLDDELNLQWDVTFHARGELFHRLDGTLQHINNAAPELAPGNLKREFTRVSAAGEIISHTSTEFAIRQTNAPLSKQALRLFLMDYTTPNFPIFSGRVVPEVEGAPRIRAGHAANGQSRILLDTGFLNGSLFYTLDGSTPTTNSTRYTGPIVPVATNILAVVAYSDDFKRSAMSTPALVGSVFPPHIGIQNGNAVITSMVTAKYQLERKDNLAAAAWTPVGAATLTNAFTVPITDQRAFFRLIQSPWSITEASFSSARAIRVAHGVQVRDDAAVPNQLRL